MARTPLELSWQQVVARRVARSHLAKAAPRARLVDVVRELPLVQAQVLSAAELGVCLRVRGTTRADVRRELYERRTLVKTWSIRGTLHLVPADELAWWSAAVSGREPYWHTREWLAKHSLTARRASRLFDAVIDALDGCALTRAELADTVGHAGLRSGWGELLGPLAAQGLICFAQPEGAKVTFARVDQWLGPHASVDPDDARRKVLRRYLHAHGPAKPGDARKWTGFDQETVRAFFSGAEVEEVRVEGVRAWMLANDKESFASGAESIRLLPQYDAYVLGFRPRHVLVEKRVQARVEQDPRGRFETVVGVQSLLVDGIVTGLWRRGAHGKVELDRVLPLPRGRGAELNEAVAHVERLG